MSGQLLLDISFHSQTEKQRFEIFQLFMLHLFEIFPKKHEPALSYCRLLDDFSNESSDILSNNNTLCHTPGICLISFLSNILDFHILTTVWRIEIHRYPRIDSKSIMHSVEYPWVPFRSPKSHRIWK